MRNSRLTLIAAWITLNFTTVLPAQFKGASPPPSEYRQGFESIQEENAREILSLLAGPKFQGRGTGQPGYTKAAHWVAGKLAEYGFEPLGERGTYFQFVPMTRISLDAKSSFLTGPNKLRIEGAEQIGFTAYSNRPSVTGQVVVIRVTGSPNQPPKNLMLRDKIAVVVSDKDNAGFLTQLRRARPLAIVSVSEGSPVSSSRVVREGSSSARSGAISANISRDAFGQLAQALQIEPKILEAAQKPGVAVHQLDKSITVQVRMKQEPVFVPNVVGWFPGSDPKLNHEHITIGAHLDHLGKRNNSVYWGADDNGSGSTAILMLARAVALNPVKPKRSVLFISFAAEELGLVGAKHYCDHPAKPLKDMICMLNMDMVGGNESRGNEKAEDNLDTIHLVGTKKGFSGLHELILKANQHVGFKFEYDQEDVFRRSDQAAFFNKGVPVAFLFAGFHPRYHQPTDTLKDINYHKIVSAARLDYLTLMMASEHGRFAKKSP